jgi:hypothetical protein
VLEEQRLKIFGNTMLMRIYGHNRDEIKREHRYKL